ncbi:hypothetical protein RhiirA1_536333 [Rhizophagus irregularis]|uniref:F-box domain-containing protein n=1 Tax=Rhizophagus irregularis TaxID=588596 RepID=A0A2N0R965_9GLOM|nr:hypothetical protein RhiirA1_540243 [Rhizophagus irregularis]PKC65437.1 hypothetical protein RhiirA1_536333 [Rhizophagus irregularis]
MSCSKIFSGDLPELIYEIIKYFRNDYSTLHSCILVNRLWCRLTIPLLWEDPFSILNGNYNFIEIYLYNLNDYLKTKLNEYQIIDNLLTPSSSSNNNTLFNYPNFIKYLNICKIIPCIEGWLESNERTSKFINLNTLEIEISITDYYNTCADNILEFILQNPNFIKNIKNLKFSILSSNKLIKNRILQIINSHQNLKRILLGYNNFSLYQSLLLSNESNCSNTLNTIIFYYIDFKSLINLVKVFEKLNVLESVHIIYCYSLDTGFIQQIINLNKPFKLKSLFISGRLQIQSLQSLLQKSGNYLENFGYGFGITNYDQLLKQQLLELIIKYCKNIKFLNLHRIENQITSLIFNLIENIKQFLNYLSINLVNHQVDNIKLILQNLGQSLPIKLEYLSMILHIKENDFEIFLKNSQNTFFKKLLINNMIREYSNDNIDILPYIKEYIMKKERVKYLAIKNTFIIRYNRKNVDLSDLKDEVKEFKLYNIKVLNYNDLSTDIYRYINEID